jgi:hypothetical protein
MDSYQLTKDLNCIIRLSDGAFIPVDVQNADYQAYEQWCADGNTALPVPAVTVNDIIAEFLPQLQAWLDGIARQNGYDTALSCISYENCTVAQWAQDAAAMKAFRAALWQWAYAQQATLNAMTPAQLAALTVDQIIAQAPNPADSGWVVHPSPAPPSPSPAPTPSP